MSLTRIASAILLASGAASAVSAEPADIEQVRSTTGKLIKLLVDQGVLSRDKAEVLLKEAAAPLTAGQAVPAGAAKTAAGAGTGTVRVPYVPEFVRKEIKDEIKAELQAQAAAEGWAKPGSVPEWVRGLNWEGDLRIRYQYDRYSPDNAPAVNVLATNTNRSLTLLNTSQNRSRFLTRARLGLNATLDENWSLGARLTTGTGTNPISTNQTLGVYNNRYSVGFDRAFVRYRYRDDINVVAGRIGNPWFGTDLLWANDLSFDGVAAQWTPRFNPSTRGFVTLAAMPVQEAELSSADKWLFGAQVGAESSNVYGGVSGKFGLGLYSYVNLAGKTSPAGSTANEFTAPQFAQKGNTYYNISSDPSRPLLALASDYRLVNLTGSLDIPAVSNTRVIVTGDFVKNIGFKRAAVSERAGIDVEPKTKAYLLRVAFGNREVSKRGDWQVFGGYKHVERDAVLDAFSDGDLHLGGTDTKGYIIGASYGLGRNTSTTLRLLSADAISGPPLAIDVVQFDLNIRF